MFIVAIAMLIGIGYVAGYFTRDRRTTTKEDTKDRVNDLFIFPVEDFECFNLGSNILVIQKQYRV